MQKLVREYLNEWNRKQKKRRKAGIAAALLVVLVVGAVFGTLTQYGIAMTGNAECGLEEHTHTDGCYTDALVCGMAVGEGAHTHNEDCYMTERALVCVLEESEEHTHTDDCYEDCEIQICEVEESDGHTHTDACYEKQLTCEKKEHTHTDSCYTAEDETEDAPDATADVESQDIWDAEYENINLPDAWGEKLAAVAQMQIGNKESENNYTVEEDGSQNGYTRYGQFVDDVYRDHWDTAFANFCMYYAGLTETELFPDEKDGAGQYQEELTDAEIWQEEFKKINKENDGTLACLTEAAGYEPKAGDLVFFEKDTGDGSGAKESRMGIVSSYNKETDELKVIEGDSNDAVEENTYGTDDDQITGYLQTTSLEEDWNNAGSQYSLRSEAPVEMDDGTINETDGEQGAGDAYVKDFRIVGMIDGSAPFDENNDPGNDENRFNAIVRTFDTVQYGFHIETASENTAETLQNATVKLKFVLPASNKQAEFDMDAMSWLENSEIQTIESDDSTEVKQVLTGEVTLSSEKCVVPGSYESTVTIKIKDMTNGTTLNPTFFAAMENKNKEESWKEIEAGEVTVSATPKYNVYVDGEVSYRDTFNFNTGNSDAANYGIGNFHGNVLKVGVVLQLYNDNASKGLKGIQLPDPDSEITFQFKIDSKYTPSNGSSVDVMEEYMPLLWSFDSSRDIGYGNADKNGRTLNDLYWSRTMVPDNTQENPESGENACYNGGTWNARQDGNTITVTVNGWEIDPEKMPKKNGVGTRDVYAENVGCFSAGEFVFIQPVNKANSTSVKPNFDIVNDYGEGVFSTSIVTDGELSVGDETYKSKDSGNKSVIRSIGLTLPGEMTNIVGYLEYGERWLSPGYTSDRFQAGHFGHGDGYILAGEILELAGGITYMPSDEYGTMCWGSNLMKFDGDKLELTGEIRDTFGNEPHNKATLDGKGMVLNENTFVYYAAKPDGENWTDYEEMKTTYEKDLYFYKSLDDIKRAGKTCVGILTCFKGSGSKESIRAIYQVAHEAKVVRKDDYIGTTCAVISTSRAWSETMLEDENIELDDIQFTSTRDDKGVECFNGLPDILRTDEYRRGVSDYKCYKPHLRSGNIYGRTWDYEEDTTGVGTGGTFNEWVGAFYKPTEYGVDGNITDPHNATDMNWGDTLLILGYKSEITKSLMQTVDQKVGNETKKVEKTIFDLSQDQSVVDYKLEPKINLGKAGTGRIAQTTTVKIVDTLPKYMEYIPGSTYFGGDYQQISPQGGQQGIITGGAQGNLADEKTDSTGKRILTWTMEVMTSTQEKTSMKITQVIENMADGSQTLTWTIEDMPISWVMEPIYYSAKIKNEISRESNDHQVSIPQKNVVYITSTDDKRGRDPELKNGNYAEKDITAQLTKKTSHGKTVSQALVEEDGTLDYTIYYNNFDATANKKTAVVVDTMPKDGLNGSEFDCDYEVVECTLDNESRAGIRIYYTEKAIDTEIPDEVENYDWTNSDWEEATITQDGEIQFGNCKRPIVWAAVKELSFGESIHVNLKIKLFSKNLASDETNKIVNLVKSTKSSGSVTAETETVRRVLEGLTWLDYNHDGLQDEDEKLLSGVNVELLKLKDGTEEVGEEESYEAVCYSGTDNPVVIQTGQQVSVRKNSKSITWYGTETPVSESKPEDAAGIDGHYRFMDLPPGTYAVRFSDPEGNEIICKLKATKVNAGEDIRDSDGTPTYEGDNESLVSTIIYDIEMPTAEEIEERGESAVYRSEHNDSGFYPNSGLQIQKTDEDGDTSLSGAIFTFTTNEQDESTGEQKETAVSFIKKGDGSYMMSDPETEGQPEAGKFLIALASDRSKVMGVDDDGNIKLQERASGQSQLFEIYDVADGYKAVKSVDTGKWMGLPDTIASGGTIQMQNDNEDSPVNQALHWTFKEWQNGECDIIPRQDASYKVGIGGNGTIQLSDGKDGMSEKFLVIPAAKYGETTELEVDGNGQLKIENLRSNTSYKIEEIKSPDGYRVLNEPVEIIVDEDGNVTLNLSVSGGGMAEVIPGDSTDRGGMVLNLKIRNNELYELPSAGGIGIYWYTIGGMLLMFAAALILYKNKCKEVLGG